VSQIALFSLSAVLLALAIFVWRAKPQQAFNRWFACQTFFLASWVCGIGGLQGGTHLDAWGRFTFASAGLISAAFLGFTQCYPTPSRWPSTQLVWGILLVGTALATLSLTTSLVVYDNILTPRGLVRKSGPLFPVFAVYVIATWLTAFGVVINKWRRARGLARAQLQYLGTGVIIAATGGIGINLLLPLITGHSTYSWLGPYFSFVYVVLVAHAIIRHSLLDLRPVINRGITYALTVSLVSGVGNRHTRPPRNRRRRGRRFRLVVNSGKKAFGPRHRSISAPGSASRFLRVIGSYASSKSPNATCRTCDSIAAASDRGFCTRILHNAC
jgi:N-terminal 7TM region of histidine kinase